MGESNSSGGFWDGFTANGIFSGVLGALPAVLDKPGKGGLEKRGAETAPPAPTGSATAFDASTTWTMQNKGLLLGGAAFILVVILLRKA